LQAGNPVGPITDLRFWGTHPDIETEDDAMLNSAIARAQKQARLDRRATERKPVHIRSVMVDITMADEQVTITNISTLGVLIEGRGKYQVGARISISLPYLGTTDAVIRWSGKGLIGCEFIEPLDEEDFFDVMANLHPATSLPAG
jgi:hypothetical protein